MNSVCADSVTNELYLQYNINDKYEIINYLEKHKNTINILISDTGVGISSEQLDKIFDRFYRVDTSRTRATGGSGLGLSIVQSIAHTYNGEITLASKPGQGTVAKLSFPIAHATY